MSNPVWSKTNILDIKCDAIVNAANSSLLRGSGVCGAIFNKAGPELDSECSSIYSKFGEIPVSKCVTTRGYNTQYNNIIHAVGPIYTDYTREIANKFLFKTYTNILNLCDILSIKSVAIPAISCGVYGFPIKDACIIATTACSVSNTKVLPVLIGFDVPVIEEYQRILGHPVI